MAAPRRREARDHAMAFPPMLVALQPDGGVVLAERLHQGGRLILAAVVDNQDFIEVGPRGQKAGHIPQNSPADDLLFVVGGNHDGDERLPLSISLHLATPPRWPPDRAGGPEPV